MTIKPTGRSKSLYVDQTKTPAAIFVFRYRSRRKHLELSRRGRANLQAEALISSMIIPRPESPPPIEDRAELTATEIRELQKQVKELKELKASAINVKRERTEDPALQPQKRMRSSPGENDVVITIDEDGVRETPAVELPPRQRTEVIDLASD